MDDQDEKEAVLQAWKDLARDVPSEQLYNFLMLKDCHDELKQNHAEDLKSGTTISVLVFRNRSNLLNTFQSK